MKKAILCALVVLLPSVALGHSWVTCTDYRIDESVHAQLDTYDDTKCFGYPRHWANYDRGFGVDAGYNYQPTDNQPCLTQFGTDKAYTDRYPMAKYSPGQKVCLSWPAKNHVAAACNNIYIPDGGTKILRSNANPTADPTQAQFKVNVVADLGKTNTPANDNDFYSRQGFQRCPLFCSNNDKPLCSGCFTIPSDLAAGTYTFQWYWEFNPGSFYSTCWEAQVGPGLGNNDNAPPSGSNPPTAAPTTPSGTLPPLAPDTIRLSRFPTQIVATEAFDVEVEYSAAGGRAIVIDILSVPDRKWYGKGAATVQEGSSKTTITVTPQNSPPDYQSYILKAWLVDETYYNDDPATAYNYELARQESPLVIGNTVIYTTALGTSDPTFTAGAVAGAFFGGVLAVLIIGGVIFFVRSRKSGKI